MEIITSYKPLTRSIASTISPFQHILSSATHQIQGFLVQLTLPSLSLIYRKDEATSGLAPVLLSPVEPWLLLLQTGHSSTDDPTLGLLMGLNRRPALAQRLKIIHSV